MDRASATSTARGLHGENVEGEDPLEQFGKHAARALKRLDGMSNCSDLVVISMLDPDTEQIAAFEELIGSHGGMGGPQNEPLILYPQDWELAAEPLVGASAVHDQLVAWLGGTANCDRTRRIGQTKAPRPNHATPNTTPVEGPHGVMKAQATFLGHSTVLVEMGGARILTDPVLFDRITLLRRAVSPLPPEIYDRIDAVLISHLHLDHFDIPSLRFLGINTPLVVPQGAGRLLRRHGVRQGHRAAGRPVSRHRRRARDRRRRRRTRAFDRPSARTRRRSAT